MSEDNYILNLFELLNKLSLEEAISKFKLIINLFLKEDKKLSLELGSILPSNAINKDFISQFSLFLKFLLYSDIEEDVVIEKLFKKFKLLEIDNKDSYALVLKELMAQYKSNRLNHNLIDYKYQLAVVDKATDNISYGKFDKVEVKFNFKVNEGDKNVDQLVNFNYYEFKEVFDNLKKVEKQLKAFK